MAEVFKAEYLGGGDWPELAQGSLVALKRLLPTAAEDLGCRSAFDQECRSAPLLDHERIVKTHGVFHHCRNPGLPTEPVLVSEYLEGKRLVALYPKEHLIEPQSWEVIAAIGLQVSEALAYLHRFREQAHDGTGLIHGDLSPKNIIMTQRGNLKVFDFGTVIPIGCDSTGGPTRVGGHGYMSPEYVREEVLDCRSDFFSMGILLYELATGERLFNACSPAETMDCILSKTIEPLGNIRPDIPTPLGGIIDSCLARNPEQRPPSAQALREMFSSHLGDAAQDRSMHTLAVWFEEVFGGSAVADVEEIPASSKDGQDTALAHNEGRGWGANTESDSSAERDLLQPEHLMGVDIPLSDPATGTVKEHACSTRQSLWVWLGAFVLFAFMLATTIWYVEHMIG